MLLRRNAKYGAEIGLDIFAELCSTIRVSGETLFSFREQTMADTQLQIERVWGGGNPGTFNRESAIKKHLEESEASRARQEQEAAQARRAAEKAREEAERQTRLIAEQTRLAEEAAWEARRHAEQMAWEDSQTRQAPETLFRLDRRSGQMLNYCVSTINDQKKLSEQAIGLALETFRPFYQELSTLNSNFLLDFKHKQMLVELRDRFDPLWQELNDLRRARQAERLSGMRPQIKEFCRDLLKASEKLDLDEILRRREAIHAYCEELKGISSIGELDDIKKLRSEFQKLVSEVNAATDWQIKCDVHNANAKAEAKFQPLQGFTPKQLQDAFADIEFANELESKAEKWRQGTSKVLYVLPCFFVMQLITEGTKFIGFLAIFLTVVALISAVTGYCVRKGALKKAQNIYAYVNQYFPNANLNQLRDLSAEAKWDGRAWAIPYEKWANMLDLNRLKICLPG